MAGTGSLWDLLMLLLLQCRYGRRRSLIVAHVITGVALIISPFVPQETGKNHRAVERLMFSIALIARLIVVLTQILSMLT